MTDVGVSEPQNARQCKAEAPQILIIIGAFLRTGVFGGPREGAEVKIKGIFPTPI